MPEPNSSAIAAAGAIAGFFRRHSLFAGAALFAFLGQFIAAGAMTALNGAGAIDFKAIDASETAAFYVLAGTFLAQIVFLLIGLARSGVTAGRIGVSLAALVWAISWLMLLFVSLQCRLYGACL